MISYILNATRGDVVVATCDFEIYQGDTRILDVKQGDEFVFTFDSSQAMPHGWFELQLFSNPCFSYFKTKE